MNIRNHGKAEVLSLLCELETWNGLEYELKTEPESDIGEDSNKGDYSAFVLTLKLKKLT